MRTAEAAEYLGITERALRLLGKSGALTPAYQAKGVIYWSRAQLERFAMVDVESYGTEKEQQNG
jgi:DNA-binding transcriptional MerR regulator